jgi:hypothetical protein
MKLSKLSTDEALDILCELTPYINNIVTDDVLLDELKAKVKATGNETKAEIMAMGAEKINKIVPVVLKEHKADIFGILASLNGTDIDAIGKQNIIKTMSQIRDLIKDKEFLDFFKSCAEQEQSE